MKHDALSSHVAFPWKWIIAAFILWLVALISVRIIYACTPLPICEDNGDVRPCATPTPTIGWDVPTCSGDFDCAGPVQDGQDCIDGCYITPSTGLRCMTCTNPVGHRIYWRYPEWAWDDNRFFDLPCLLKKDYSVTPPLYLGKFCPGRQPTGWPIQRNGIWEGQVVEFRVSAYNEVGQLSTPIPLIDGGICVSPLCPSTDPERSRAISDWVNLGRRTCN